MSVNRTEPSVALQLLARWPSLSLLYLRIHFVRETAVDEGGVYMYVCMSMCIYMCV